MNLKIVDVEVHEEENYNIIWFEVDLYPSCVYGLKRYPSAKIKQDYIVIQPPKEYFDVVESIRYLEEKLVEIKKSIEVELNTNKRFRIKLLSTTGPFNINN
jgi:hypothetical protein